MQGAGSCEGGRTGAAVRWALHREAQKLSQPRGGIGVLLGYGANEDLPHAGVRADRDRRGRSGLARASPETPDRGGTGRCRGAYRGARAEAASGHGSGPRGATRSCGSRDDSFRPTSADEPARGTDGFRQRSGDRALDAQAAAAPDRHPLRVAVCPARAAGRAARAAAGVARRQAALAFRCDGIGTTAGAGACLRRSMCA